MKLRHYSESGNWYFVTTTLRNPYNIFIDESLANLALNVLHARLMKGGFQLDEFVLMPDHFHIIVIPLSLELAQIIGELKRSITRLVNASSGVGQRSIWLGGYYDVQIGSEKELFTKRQYVWHNPVRAGLVKNPEDYAFSSANTEVRKRFGLATLE